MPNRINVLMEKELTQRYPAGTDFIAAGWGVDGAFWSQPNNVNTQLGAFFSGGGGGGQSQYFAKPSWQAAKFTDDHGRRPR